ncbi:MAG: hypothetical protein M3071_18975 [Actinomycetota bacterium]|nr:hypothetical protein [Actinomycetota bacterium]
MARRVVRREVHASCLRLAERHGVALPSRLVEVGLSVFVRCERQHEFAACYRFDQIACMEPASTEAGGFTSSAHTKGANG